MQWVAAELRRQGTICELSRRWRQQLCSAQEGGRTQGQALQARPPTTTTRVLIVNFDFRSLCHLPGRESSTAQGGRVCPALEDSGDWRRESSCRELPASTWMRSRWVKENDKQWDDSLHGNYSYHNSWINSERQPSPYQFLCTFVEFMALWRNWQTIANWGLSRNQCFEIKKSECNIRYDNVSRLDIIFITDLFHLP